MLIVSLDCHIDAESPRMFEPYVDSAFKVEFEAWVGAMEKSESIDQMLEKQLSRDYMQVRGKATAEFFVQPLDRRRLPGPSGPSGRHRHPAGDLRRR
jgi:hypothetical protein